MIPAARLQATLELLDAIERTPRPADALVSGYFRSRRYIGSKDRASVATLTYAILRHEARLKWWLERKLGAQVSTPRLRLLTYLTLAEKKPAKEITALFTGKKFSPAPLANDEEALLKKLTGHTIEHPEMPEEVKTECPDWAFAALKNRFGKTFVAEMRALLQPAALDLRINPLKATREDIMAELKNAGIAAEPCKFSPLGVRVEERPSLRVLPMLKTAAVEIQDEGSQLAAMLVDARAGQRVVDFCAGAGGKTLAISAQMQNKGRIIACDVLPGRLKRAAERFRRAGLHNIDVRVLKNENDPWVKRHRESYDHVLVDAPCSGTGTWRRNPDARWHGLGPALDNLLVTQNAILTSAARLVKPGGRLVYATCSLLPQENERQIESFLAAHKDFSVIPCRAIWKDAPETCEPYLMLTPAQHGTDGFFAAVLGRAPKADKVKDAD